MNVIAVESVMYLARKMKKLEVKHFSANWLNISCFSRLLRLWSMSQLPMSTQNSVRSDSDYFFLESLMLVVPPRSQKKFKTMATQEM